jgi:antitoxin component of RelBE/YafQ-DinJ toxin-antitoxin module
MSETIVSLQVDVELASKAEVIFSDFGMDINTGINNILEKLVKNEIKPFQLKPKNSTAKISNRADLEGFLHGKIQYDDNIFFETLECMKDYMP